MEPLTFNELQEQTRTSLDRIHNQRYASKEEVDAYFNNLKTDSDFLLSLRNAILRAVEEGRYETTLTFAIGDPRIMRTIERNFGLLGIGCPWNHRHRDNECLQHIESIIKSVAQVKAVYLKRVDSYLDVSVSWLTQ